MENIGRTRLRKMGGHPKQLARFLLVGILNVIVTFALFLTLLWAAGIHYAVSNVLAFSIWGWFGYELQRRLVFEALGGPAVFARYMANQIVFMLVGTGLLTLLVDIARFPPAIGYVVMVLILTTGLFLSSKFLVFLRPSA